MPSSPKGLSVIIVLGLVGLVFALAAFWTPSSGDRSYRDFVQDVIDGKVQHVMIRPQSLIADYKSLERVEVNTPAATASMEKLLLDHGVAMEFLDAAGNDVWSMLLSLFVPVALVGGAIWYMSRQQSGSGTGQALFFSQSRARMYSPGDRPVKLDDVAGMPEVKEELAEIIDFLRSSERYLDLGARIPKGVLLWGPPGTGKTLLARAIAGEAGVPFFSISGSDFVEVFAGVGAARVRELFTKARRFAPCILFVDEIDAVGRQRGIGIGGGNDEREQTLNQLLVEMDGFSANEGIIVVAATNRIDVLDAAILRPGRFDRQINIDPPDRKGRREILAVHSADKPLGVDVNLDHMADLTMGFTGADLANLLNEAAIVSARRRQKAIGMTEIMYAYERIVIGGPPKGRGLAPHERMRVAVHEAGHAVVSRQLTHSDPIAKVTILPRGRALGYVMYRPTEEKHLHSRAEFQDRIVSLLGGRAAEEVVLGEASTGASDDLERVTALARSMVTELGMDGRIGPVRVDGEPGVGLFGGGARPISERTAAMVDASIREFITHAYDRATALVRERRHLLDRLTEALLERESIDGEALDQLMAEG